MGHIKSQKNLLNHGISFADIFAVFDDPNAVTLDDHGSEEQRFITIGMDAFGRILGGGLHMAWRQYSDYFGT